MNTNEERLYLEELLFESTLWRGVEQDSPYSPIELEIRSRLHRLSSADEVQVQADPTPEQDIVIQAIEASRMNEHLEEKKKQKQYTEAKKEWGRDRVRVFIDGKPVWKPREFCCKVKRDNSKGGLPWTWKFVGPQDIDKLSDELWKDHEDGNDM